MKITEKVRIVLSPLTNVLYLATKKTKRELTEQELDLIKYKIKQDLQANQTKRWVVQK